MENAARMFEEPTETELLAEMRQGSRRAFGRFYETHQRRVFSVAVTFFGGNREIAEDITQQIFVRIFQKVGDFREDSNIRTWIYRMTINACIDEQRKRRRFFSLDGFFGEIRSKRSEDEAIRQREMSEQVRAAIGELKEHYRIPLMLKYLEDLSYEEIATILECSVGTVSSRLNRGHKKLAKRLAHLKDLI